MRYLRSVTFLSPMGISRETMCDVFNRIAAKMLTKYCCLSAISLVLTAITSERVFPIWVVKHGINRICRKLTLLLDPFLKSLANLGYHTPTYASSISKCMACGGRGASRSRGQGYFLPFLCAIVRHWTPIAIWSGIFRALRMAFVSCVLSMVFTVPKPHPRVLTRELWQGLGFICIFRKNRSSRASTFCPILGRGMSKASGFLQ